MDLRGYSKGTEKRLKISRDSNVLTGSNPVPRIGEPMTIIKREVEIPAVPAKVEEREVGRLCVFCGRKANDLDNQEDSANWANDAYVRETVVIRLSNGETFPECSNREYEEWDVCPECFDTRIRPLLPKDSSNKEEVDW